MEFRSIKKEDMPDHLYHQMDKYSEIILGALRECSDGIGGVYTLALWVDLSCALILSHDKENRLVINHMKDLLFSGIDEHLTNLKVLGDE
jgi:hypothetical protein